MSKALALIFGPKAHFLGPDCGRAVEYESGLISFSKLHHLFRTHQKDLVPDGTHAQTNIVISFFKTLGICRQVSKDEAKAHHFPPGEAVFEFPDLCQISDLPFLPSEQQPDKEPEMEQSKVLCVGFHGFTQYDFSKLRQKLVSMKHPIYRSFLNSIIVKRNNCLELWFHRGEHLQVIIRGPTPIRSINDIDRDLAGRQVRSSLLSFHHSPSSCGFCFLVIFPPEELPFQFVLSSTFVVVLNFWS